MQWTQKIVASVANSGLGRTVVTNDSQQQPMVVDGKRRQLVTANVSQVAAGSGNHRWQLVEGDDGQWQQRVYKVNRERKDCCKLRRK